MRSSTQVKIIKSQHNEIGIKKTHHKLTHQRDVVIEKKKKNQKLLYITPIPRLQEYFKIKSSINI